MTDALPTREDYFQVGASEVIARSAQRPEQERISRAAIFAEGTDINIIIAACSAMADEATRQMAARLAALYLDSAEDEDLDRLVADRFSPEIARKQASPAAVTLQFSRPIPPSTGAPVTFPAGAKFRTAQGTEFRLIESVSLPLNSTGPVSGVAQATLAGLAGNVAAGTIQQFVQTPSDSAILVTNEEPASGGRDVESDSSLRERARQFFATARRGTIPAIEFGALQVPGVESATANEELDPESGLPTGRITLSIADRNGQSNSVLATAVVEILREYRAGGIIVDVLTTQPEYLEIAYDGLQFRSGTDTRVAVQQIKNLVVAAVNLLVPGQPLERSLLFALARSVPGVVVPDTAVAIPAGDVLIPASRVGKTRLDLVTVNGV